MCGLPDVDIDRLISAVQSKPLLWDKTCEKYKDKFKTQEAWKDVCIEIFADYDELDVSKRMEFGKLVLKKWTQVRDSYRKSISKTKAKSGAGSSKAKIYIYASKLEFLNKIFEERETEDNYSQNIDSDNYIWDEAVEINDFPVLSVPSESRDAVAVEKTESSKKRKLDSVELQLIAALKETTNRHLLFFKGLLPSIEDFDEYDTIDFQIEVLKIVKQIRQRKHPLLASTILDTSHTSPSSTPPTVPNQDIHLQPDQQ